MSSIAFKASPTQYTPLNESHGLNGAGVIIARAHGALTAKTPYKVILNEYGFVTAAMTTAVGRCFVGIPDKAYTSGQDAVMQIAGYVTDVVTPSITSAVGYGVKIDGGVIVSSGADWRGLNTEIGAWTEVSTGTTHDIMLYGKEIFEGAQSYGSSTNPVTDDTAGRIFMGAYFDNGAATGTARGHYVRLYLTGGAGGEAGRFYTTVSNNAPVDTCNGIHASLSFGASAGNITGLGTAGRFTLHIPNRALTGTCAAVQAELHCDGTASDVSGITSAIRVSVGGDATGYGTIQSKVYFAHFDAGCVDATDGMIDSNRTAITAGGSIKIYIDGVGERWITYTTGS